MNVLCDADIEFEVQLSIECFGDVFKFVRKYGTQMELEKCLNFLEENVNQFIADEILFIHLPFVALAKLLTVNALNVSEANKFALLRKWQQKHIYFEFNDLLRLIKWCEISAADYAVHIRPLSVITDDQYFQLFYESKAEQLSFNELIDELVQKYDSAEIEVNQNESERSQIDENENECNTEQNLDEIVEEELDFKTDTYDIPVLPRRMLNNTSECKVNVKHELFTQEDEKYVSEEYSFNECHYCGKRFNKRRIFMAHMKLHESNNDGDNNNDSNAIECKPCETSKSNLVIYSFGNQNLNTKVPVLLPECSASTSSSLNSDFKDTMHMKANNTAAYTFLMNRKQRRKKTELFLKRHRKPSVWYSDATNSQIKVIYRNGERKYACKICEKVFGVPERVRRHVSTVHLNERHFKCEYCGKSFTQKPSLHDHIESTHINVRSYKCHICDGLYTTRKYLMMHITRVHEGRDSGICGYCGVHYKSKQCLKQHIEKRHSLEITFQP
ncbi:hypothetical protein B4U80_04282 [Leptotrombidium deliense]|uniref:C2H2-type domain-containing protein n=1 Tax=Leptotrombidium deliense TaxID=299467 RepID=A0A443SPI9_9ACAR|nr:hypothetical protein B4U80_04282 [Leptotrombidium deliense]